MPDGPNIARVAALIGEPARANMLSALADGRALTATELALEAGVSKQTASSHLAKLSDGNLIAAESQGRHRYYRLADADVAHLLEKLMGVAERAHPRRIRPGPREPALRHARICYDHLDGDCGVALYDALVAHKRIAERGGEVAPTKAGRDFFCALGLDLDALASSKRPLCRACLDWSVRRHHLAGALGAALLAHMIEKGWARRRRDSRVLDFTPHGDTAFRRAFAIEPTAIRGERA
ncbi:MAG: helix-turn-helix transcriptional regulator [Pseudomonadota bacterium]